MDEKKISLFMENLKISREEAIQVIQDDYAIDHGEKLFELDAEKKKVAKKMKNGARAAVNAYGKKVTVNRKPDEAKRYFIEEIAKLLQSVEGVTDITIENPQKQIDYFYQNRKMRVVLSAPTKT